MSANTLVAGPASTSSALSGTGVVESVADLCSALDSGSWLSVGLTGVGAVLDVAATVIDPVGSLIAAGLGWLMEHLEPLKGWLDDLTGDAGAVQGFAATWDNVAGAMGAAGDELNRLVRVDLEAMSGEAVTAYAAYADALAERIRVTGASATSIGSALRTCATVVQVVHDLVRDTLAQLVGSIISWATEAALTLGLATPVIAGQVSTRVSQLATRVGRSVTDVLTSAKSLKNLLEAMQDALRRLTRTESNAVSRSTTTGAGLLTTTPRREASWVVSGLPSTRPGFLPSGDLDPSSFVTEPDTAFFWSGRTGDGHDIGEFSEAFARQRGGITLEGLMSDRGIELPEWDFEDAESVRLWTEASGHYAEAVSGEVRAVIGTNLRPGSVWETVELPRLARSPAVARIVQIDPETGIEKVVYP